MPRIYTHWSLHLSLLLRFNLQSRGWTFGLDCFLNGHNPLWHRFNKVFAVVLVHINVITSQFLQICWLRITSVMKCPLPPHPRGAVWHWHLVTVETVECTEPSLRMTLNWKAGCIPASLLTANFDLRRSLAAEMRTGFSMLPLFVWAITKCCVLVWDCHPVWSSSYCSADLVYVLLPSVSVYCICSFPNPLWNSSCSSSTEAESEPWVEGQWRNWLG